MSPSVDDPRESVIEAYLVSQVEDVLDGLCLKYKNPSRSNAPDRIAFLYGPRLWLIELKRKGEKPNDGQLREHERYRRRGFKVAVIDSKRGVDEWIIERRVETMGVR